MRTFDFSKFYYGSADCFISNINFDVAPSVRVAGADVTTGYGVVYTAIGTRFDLDHVANEAFRWSDNYESDFRAIDGMPIAETMRYIRMEAVDRNFVPKRYQDLVFKVKDKVNLYGEAKVLELGEKEAGILFLPGPASSLDDKNAKKFLELCEKNRKTAYVTSKFNDCGYMLLELGQYDDADKLRSQMKAVLEEYDQIVTDDGYVFDALNILFSEFREKLMFIDEFLAGLEHLNISQDQSYVLHESGVINRIYPNKWVDYGEFLEGLNLRLPIRSGFDVTDAGISGGLGFFDSDLMDKITRRRILDFELQENEVVLTPCTAEAFALRRHCEKVVTLLDIV